MNDNQIKNLASLYEDNDEDNSQNSEEYFYASLKQGGNRYENSRFIAQGGEKTITRTYDSQTGRDVAMATLHADAPKERYESFLREARLTALMDHPNIVSIFDIALDAKKQPYFTMELKTGDGLDEVIKKLSQEQQQKSSIDNLNQLLNIFLKVCDAIAYAHSKGVLHLDIKPDNIQIGDFGEVVVCDWGLGKVIGSADKTYDTDSFNADLLNDITLTGIIKGTPGYMAPEQVLEGKEKTIQTDIYSLGCLLYSILTYERPITGETKKILMGTVKGDITPPCQRVPKKNIPESLEAVVLKAISLSPEDRYENISQLSHEIQNYLNGFATAAENASIFKGFHLLYKRNKTILNASFCFCLLTLFLIASFIQRLNEKTDIAIKERKNALVEKQRVETALLRYENQKKQVTALNIQREIMPASQKKAIKGFYENPVKTVAKHLETLEKKGWNNRTEIHRFVSQDFKGILTVITPVKKSNAQNKIIRLYKKYNEYPKNAQDLLSIQHLTALLQEPILMPKRYFEWLVIYDLALRKDLTGYETVIKALLEKWNGPLQEN
jgi:serine/threonine protein kinase